MAQGLAAAIFSANDKHLNIYAGANRWVDPDPNWFSTKNVSADLEAASINFDSSQTQGYPMMTTRNVWMKKTPRWR